jgi:hypothetical protein
VREHGAGGDVADDPDAVSGFARWPSCGDEAALVGFDADRFEAEVLREGTAADGDEDDVGVERSRAAAFGGLDRDLQPLRSFSTPVTLWPSSNDALLLEDRWKLVEISVSIAGVILSRNSTTVTSAPRRRQTEPSSRPMTPAPMTIIFFGTAFSDSAPVEETMRSSSTSTPGSGVTLSRWR